MKQENDVRYYGFRGVMDSITESFREWYQTAVEPLEQRLAKAESQHDELEVKLAISETRREKAVIQRDKLLVALKKVEWEYTWIPQDNKEYRTCLWCKEEVHTPDCLRQSAIGISNE